MELDFDKEIDALLRKARGGPGHTGAAPHLEADEIAAFAENALPEKTRMFFTAHLADCDRCRKILTNTISFNAEAAPEAVVVAAPVVVTSAEPWYRRLFLFPNLAYVMGGLVLVFSAFLGYSILRNSAGDYSATVSQVAETENAPGGPRLGEEAFSDSSASNSANNAANATANIMVATANKAANPGTASSNSNAAAINDQSGLLAANAPREADKNILTDGVDAASGSAVAPAPKLKESKDNASLAKAESEVSATREDERKRKTDSNAMDSKMMSQMPQAGVRGPAKKSAGPSRNMQTQFPNRAENSFDLAVTRNVGGKKFEQKQGAWYDSSYRGQATTNIRRGTEAYRNLDGGLRSITDNLGGTVVVVWKSKTYRIQ